MYFKISFSQQSLLQSKFQNKLFLFASSFIFSVSYAYCKGTSVC